MTQKTMLRTSIAGLALAACLAPASPVLADSLTFKANLTAATEVPPNDSPATGTVTAAYATATKKLTWQGSYPGLGRSDRRPGRRPYGRQVVRQHPHRRAQGRRNSRPNFEMIKS